jgi:uncharacterized protein (DUF433 family)
MSGYHDEPSYNGRLQPFRWSKMTKHAMTKQSTRRPAAKRREPTGELDRITVDTARMNGEPCIRDLRLTVRRVLEALAVYPDRAELKREYPELEDEDIRQALVFAAALVDDKILPLPTTR